MRSAWGRARSCAQLAVLLGALLASGQAQGQCENLPSSSLSVFVIRPAADVEIVPPVPGRGREASAAVDRLGAHPDLMTDARVTGRVAIERTVLPRDGLFCAAPSEITIQLGLAQRVVHLPDAADRSPCVRQALLGHAKQHADLEDRFVRNFVVRTRARFQSALVALKKAPGATEEEAYQRFRSGVEEMVRAAVMELEAARQRYMPHDTDAHGDHGELESSCGGTLHDIVWPGRRKT